jgi:hypothetical protein
LRNLLLPAVCFTATQGLAAAGAAASSKQGPQDGQPAAASAAAAAAEEEEEEEEGTDASSSSSSSNRGGMDAVSLLPWVVLIGRCYLQWGVELLGLAQQGYPPAAATAGTAAAAAAGRPITAEAIAARYRCAALHSIINEQVVSSHLAVEVLLECDSISTQLFEAGYSSTAHGLQLAVDQAGCFMLPALSAAGYCTNDPNKADAEVGRHVRTHDGWCEA